MTGGWRTRATTAAASLLAAVGMLVGGADALAVEPNPRQAPPRVEQRRAERQTTVDEVSRTVMCPSCDTTLDQSSSPAAERMRTWVIAAVDAGWTEGEIRAGLVREYGGDESVLAAPRAHGSGLLVWVVPGLIAVLALTVGVQTLRQWRLSSRVAAPGGVDASD